jgi:hypothetical protein
MRISPPPAVVVALLGLFAVSAGCSAGGSIDAMVQSGHRGAVLAAAWDPSRSVLVTGGEDGTLRSWDVAQRLLAGRIALTRLEVRDIALAPRQPLAAVRVGDTSASSTVQVWNWVTGQFQYSFELATPPLFIRFSTSGDYLLCGEAGGDGLTVVSAATGARVSLSRRDTIVGTADLAGDGQTLVAYELQGRIAAWSARTGEEIRDVPTLPMLEGARLVDGARLLVGRSIDDLLLVDTSSGPVLSRTTIPGLVDFAVGPRGTTCVVLDSSSTLRRLTISGDALRDAGVLGSTDARRVFCTAGTGAVVEAADGSAAVVPGAGGPWPLPGAVVTPISGLAAGADRLAVAVEGSVRVFDLEPGPQRGRVDLPWTTPTGLSEATRGRFYAWPLDGKGPFGIIDPDAGTFVRLLDQTEGRVVSASAGPDAAFVLTASGELSELAGDDGTPVRVEGRAGATCVAAWKGDAALVGYGPGAASTSVGLVDLRTGETVSLPTVNIYTYAIVVDRLRGIAYALGVDAERGTTLVERSGPGLSQETVLERVPRERFGATLAIDSEDGSVVASIDDGVVTSWIAGVPAGRAHRISGAVASTAARGVLVTVDKDSIVRAWGAGGKVLLASLCMLGERGWLAVRPGGTELDFGLSMKSGD